MPNRGTRTAARREYEDVVRLAWLEGDADVCDARHDAVSDELRDLRKSVDARLAKIMWGIFGLLVSICTLSIAAVANLVLA